MQNEPLKKLKDIHTLYITLKCRSNCQCYYIQPFMKRKSYLGLGWIFVMLHKMNLWMGRIGSVLLDEPKLGRC